MPSSCLLTSSYVHHNVLVMSDRLANGGYETFYLKIVLLDGNSLRPLTDLIIANFISEVDTTILRD